MESAILSVVELIIMCCSRYRKTVWALRLEE